MSEAPERRRIRRDLKRLRSIDTSTLDEGETQRHRLREAQLQTMLEAMVASKPEPQTDRKMANGRIDAGDLSKLFK
jgi:hypothetical protein